MVFISAFEAIRGRELDRACGLPIFMVYSQKTAARCTSNADYGITEDSNYS